MEEKKFHDVFVINPIELLAFVGKFVKIKLKNSEIIKGTVYTIDPVSQSIILVVRENSEEMSLKIILKHSVHTINALSEIPIDQQNVLSSEMFTLDKYSLNKNQKEDVKNWLLKNMIPVVESGDKLVVDTLEICPPYGISQCFSTNPIVLSRIQNLLKQMPIKKS